MCSTTILCLQNMVAVSSEFALMTFSFVSSAVLLQNHGGARQAPPILHPFVCFIRTFVLLKRDQFIYAACFGAELECVRLALPAK